MRVQLSLGVLRLGLNGTALLLLAKRLALGVDTPAQRPERSYICLVVRQSLGLSPLVSCRATSPALPINSTSFRFKLAILPHLVLIRCHEVLFHVFRLSIRRKDLIKGMILLEC